MKFYIPRTSPENIEFCYAGIRSFLSNDWGCALTTRRIQSLAYNVKGQRREATVGKAIGPGGEIVYAIFEARDGYLVCTPTHGVSGEPPTVIKRKDVVSATDFDAAEAQQAV